MSDRKCKHELLEIDENNRVVKCAKCGRILDKYGVGFDKNGVYITQGSDETLSQPTRR